MDVLGTRQWAVGTTFDSPPSLFWPFQIPRFRACQPARTSHSSISPPGHAASSLRAAKPPVQCSIYSSSTLNVCRMAKLASDQPPMFRLLQENRRVDNETNHVLRMYVRW